MEKLFTDIVSVSFSGAILIGIVLLFRTVARKAPKWVICTLWLLVFVRLLMPAALSSDLSLQPAPPVIVQTDSDLHIAVSNTQIHISQQPVNENGLPTDIVRDDSAATADLLQIATVVWLLGAGVMLLYTVFSYAALKYRVRNVQPVRDEVYSSPDIDTAFVLGYLNPKIYLPDDMDGNEEYVIRHEYEHIRRGDNWLKLLSFICLAVHWFNPLVWVGFVLLSRDIESACDEKVIAHMDVNERKAYSNALLTCSIRPGRIVRCPLAFGEIGIRQRIINVLKYHKPAMWSVVVSLIAVCVIIVCFATTPKPTVSVGPTEPVTQQTEPEVTAPPKETVTEPVTQLPTDAPSVAPTEAPTVPHTDESVEVPTEPSVQTPEVIPTQPPKPQDKPATDSGSTDSSEEPGLVGKIPDDVQAGDKQPAENTATHTHNYSVDTYGPWCDATGYDLHSCSCGHEYYDNFTSATGHHWVYLRTTEVSATSDGADVYGCTNCDERDYKVHEKAYYKSYDIEAVEVKAEAYATELGFKSVSQGTNMNAKMFADSDYVSDIHYKGGEKELLNFAKELVYDAYHYCSENDVNVQAHTIWVEIEFGSSTMGKLVKVRVYCTDEPYI